MKWSVSSAGIFLQCPKKWYFSTVFANSTSGNAARKEAAFLKKLSSIYAWRGKLVDQVISRHIVPKINRHEVIHEDETLRYADWLMKVQLQFAKSRMYRNPTAKTSSYDYCALLEFENGGYVNEKQIEQISKEVECAISNLINSLLLSEISKGDFFLVAQRPIQFQFANMTVKCIPDLIALCKGKAPTIIDWKTETLGYKEHWLQLGIYGVALSSAKPHRDFPCSACDFADPTKMKLIEFQLLRNQKTEYALSDEDITDIEDYVYSSSISMQQLTNGKSPEELIDTLPKSKSPEVCISCKFKKICWRFDA
jgi:hypothetical protein